MNEPIAVVDDAARQNFNLFALTFPQIADGTFQSMRYTDDVGRTLSVFHDTTNAGLIHLDISYYQQGSFNEFHDPMMSVKADFARRMLIVENYANTRTGEDIGLLTLSTGSEEEKNLLSVKLAEFISDLRSRGRWSPEQEEVFIDADGRLLPAEPKPDFDAFLKERAEREAAAHGYVQRNMFGGQTADEPEQTANRVNFHITDDHLGEGGAKTKFRSNIAAIQVIKDLEFDGRGATPEEQEILSRYVGWGGLPQAFDPDNKQWENEYLELNALLTPEEFDSARASTLEQLGCDRLYIDEAHGFKNLFLYTKMRNVAGLSTSEAQKSSDLFMKCRYMDELTGNKGIIFATGTPISNSISEMYTMQRYLQYDVLAAKHLTHFDAWASTFGETVTSIELAPEGTGYRARTRFSKFYNLPELMAMFRDVADIQTADMLNLPVPEALFENIVVEPSDLQKEMVQELSERAAAVHARRVDPRQDNMLKITTDGRKIGLDQRLINPLLPDFEGSKVNACADNVFNIWNGTKNERLTQLLFCDFSTPNKDGRFNVYDDIRAKLIQRGIPEPEIAFIHDADTETRKKELFARVRQGKVRVLFGSTFKMGAGTNVQDRLVAIHDADCPWRPADLEQRAGRIVRQGNNNDKVWIFRYSTKGTFDSYLWQTVQKKQEFIAQIMSSKSPVRSCEDVDETALSYSEIKALCAGDPRIAEKMNLDNEVAKLRMLKAEHRSQHYRLEDDLLTNFPKRIAAVSETIAGIETDITMYAAEKEKCVEVQTNESGGASVSQRFPGMVVDGVAYSEKEPAAKALLDACKGVKGSKIDLPVGEYMGFKLSLHYESYGQQINLLLRGAMTYKIDLGTDALGNLTRINHSLDKLSERLEGQRAQLTELNRQTEAAKTELEKPFTQEDELAEKEARLSLLNSDLNIDGDGEMDVLNDADARADAGDSADEPDADNDGEDYGDDEPEDNYRYADERVAQAVSAKAKPSILEGIRDFDSSKYNGAQVRDVKPVERGI